MIYFLIVKNVQNVIKTRSSTQARSHAQKFFLKIKKNLDINNSNRDKNYSLKKIFEILTGEIKNKNLVDEINKCKEDYDSLKNKYKKLSQEHEQLRKTKDQIRNYKSELEDLERENKKYC